MHAAATWHKDRHPVVSAHSDAAGPPQSDGQVERDKEVERLASWPPGRTRGAEGRDPCNGSIRREFVHSYSDRDAVELFYVTMAWGFGATNVRWPGQQAILNDPPRSKIEGIVKAVRTDGAEAGWRALYGHHRITGLGYAFGTKLLYFAGYTSGCAEPRPLILDANVLSALHDSGTGILASGGVWCADYVAYLQLASQWAADPAWPGRDVRTCRVHTLRAGQGVERRDSQSEEGQRLTMSAGMLCHRMTESSIFTATAYVNSIPAAVPNGSSVASQNLPGSQP